MKDDKSHTVLPDKVDLRISLEGIPSPITAAIENLAQPRKSPSRLRTFLKDYLPALTPIAAVVISVVVSIYTFRYDHNRSAEALDKILTEFGGNNQGERAHAIAAIKLAAYGDKALPAVKMVLGSEDRQLRSGGVLVAKQMYRAKTVCRLKLTKEILGYYAENDRFLKLGVMEWLVEMGNQLSDKEAELAYTEIKQSLGERAEKCTDQDEAVVVSAANFLFIRSFPDSEPLMLGIVRQCRDKEHSQMFTGARQSAVNTIPRIAKSLSRAERDSLLNNELPSLRRDAPDLDDLIDRAAASIREIQGP